MTQDTNISSSKGIWLKSAQTFKAALPQAVYISFLCIILPHIFFEWHLAQLAQAGSNQLSELIGFFRSGDPELSRIDFKTILQSVMLFAIKLFSAGFVLALINLLGYFALLRLYDQFHRGQPFEGLTSNLKSGLALTLKGGFLSLVFLLFMAAFAQVPLIAPMVIILLPGVMFPVLLAVERRGVMSAIRSTSSIGYARNLPGEKWAMFFQIISMAAIFYIAFVALSYSSKIFLNLDVYLGLSRAAWIEPLTTMPFSIMYLFSTILEVCLMAALLCLMAAATTTIYYWPKILSSPLPDDGIQI